MTEGGKYTKKKRCSHIRDDYMPVPAGYSRKDFLKKQRGGIDAFTQTRIKDFISYFCATNIPDNEALFLIQKQFNVKLAINSYRNLKSEVMSNIEVQTWLNSYAKIGFVAAHIQDIERTKMMTDKLVSAFLTETSKEHEERNYHLISQLTRDYDKLTKLSIVLRAGAPVLARIKAMIDASNIRALENDPTMSEEEKKKILSRKVHKTHNVITVPNTLTDDPTNVTIVTRNNDNKHIESEEIGKAVKLKNGTIVKPDLVTKKPNEDSKESSQKLEYLKEDTSFQREEQDLEDISRSESGSEFIQFLMEESKSDDILPNRLKSSLKLDSEG